jgi:hypothetical protein
MSEGSFRDYARSFWVNWKESDAPLGTKLRLTARNRWKGVATRKGCCGNHYEPGC